MIQVIIFDEQNFTPVYWHIRSESSILKVLFINLEEYIKFHFQFYFLWHSKIVAFCWPNLNPSTTLLYTETLHVKCPYSELIWSVFPHSWTEYSVSLRIHSKCGKMRTTITPDTFTQWVVETIRVLDRPKSYVESDEELTMDMFSSKGSSFSASSMCIWGIDS